MRIASFLCAAVLSATFAHGALAFDASAPDDSSPAPSAGARPTSSKANNTPRSARSIACSQQADSRSLHGKSRKHFMRDCKHAG